MDIRKSVIIAAGLLLATGTAVAESLLPTVSANLYKDRWNGRRK